MDFLTQEKLGKLIPTNKNLADWHKALVSIMPAYGITTVERAAAFIAQCAHESMDFTVLKENLGYSQQGLRKVFGKYFATDEIAAKYAKHPTEIANRVYANRLGNSDEASGDGWKYRGQGVIQLTGKTNQAKFAESMKMTLDQMETYLATIEGAVHSACWFWKTNGLNELADKKEINTISKRINGGTLGLEERAARYKKALEVLSA